jgi:hypothetical protein
MVNNKKLSHKMIVNLVIINKIIVIILIIPVNNFKMIDKKILDH